MRNLLKNVDELLLLSVTTTNKNHKNGIFFQSPLYMKHKEILWPAQKICQRSNPLNFDVALIIQTLNRSLAFSKKNVVKTHNNNIWYNARRYPIISLNIILITFVNEATYYNFTFKMKFHEAQNRVPRKKLGLPVLLKRFVEKDE